MAETLETVLGRRLALARANAGLSQLALAKSAGFSVGMVSLVENGERMPSTDYQVRWVRTCRTTLSEVYEGLEAELAKRGVR